VTAPTAFDLLCALRLEDGRHWGDAAAPFQLKDAAAIFSETGPKAHYLTRPRGGSKTSDIAGVALSWLATSAPLGGRGFIFASSVDQAAILIDAARGFIDRTPELQGVVSPENERLIGRQSAWVKVVSADGASSWGLRGALLIVCDEFAMWPETRGARRVWTAAYTAQPKTPGCRLIILTSAGEPSHFSFDVLREARRERQRKQWRVSETPGPIPWMDPELLQSQRFMLTDAEYARLHMNLWTESEDRLVSPEDLEAAAVLDGPLEAEPGRKYLVTVDLGFKDDPTAVAVTHAEPTSDDPKSPRRVVLDRIMRWKGSKRKAVLLDEVERYIAWASLNYNRAQVHADPTQAIGLVQRLNAAGVQASEFAFSGQSVGRIGQALHLALRNRQLWLPNDPDLLDELSRVRLRRSSPGVVRLDHDRGAHDDQAVVIGMACHLLLGQTGWGQGAAFMQFYKERLAQHKEHPRPPGQPTISPSAYFLAGAPLPEVSRCAPGRHRFGFGGDPHCALCGLPEEVT